MDYRLITPREELWKRIDELEAREIDYTVIQHGLVEENQHYREALERITSKNLDSLWAAKEIARETLYPEPEMEEVEVVRYGCPCCLYTSNKPGMMHGKEMVKLTGTYQHPKPQKVKRREEIDANSWPVRTKTKEEIPCGARYFAEWEEEK